MKKISLILVAFFCLLVGLVNVGHVVLPALKIPPETYYLAPGHYMPDYQGYLSLVGQGYRGYWTLVNLFTSEPTAEFWVIGWPYLVVGHLSRFFGFSVPGGYWLAVFLLTAGAAFSAFVFIRLVFREKDKRYLIFPAFLVYLFSGPFIKIESLLPLRFGLYRLNWYYLTTYFDRMSGIVHHLLSNFLVVAFFILSWYFFESFKIARINKKGLFNFFLLSLVLILIMSVTPIRVTYLLPVFGLTILYAFWQFKLKSWRQGVLRIGLFVCLGVVLLFFGLYFRRNVQGAYSPEAQEFEFWAMDFPRFSDFILGSGPVLILAVFAFWYLLRRSYWLSPVVFFGLVVTGLSNLLFFTNFSLLFNNQNSRLLFPDSYLFATLVLFFGLDQFFSGRKGSLKKKVWTITLALIILGLPSLARSLADRDFQIINPGFSPIYTYLPREIVEGFVFIESQPEPEKVVLSAQSADLGNLIPFLPRQKFLRVTRLRRLILIIKLWRRKCFWKEI